MQYTSIKIIHKSFSEYAIKCKKPSTLERQTKCLMVSESTSETSLKIHNHVQQGQL